MKIRMYYKGIVEEGEVPNISEARKEIIKFADRHKITEDFKFIIDGTVNVKVEVHSDLETTEPESGLGAIFG